MVCGEHVSRRNSSSGRGLFRLMSVLGPGILMAATGAGAGDLIAASPGGSALGLTILWAAIAGAVLKGGLNEGVARWQMATGTTLLEGWSGIQAGGFNGCFLSVFCSGLFLQAEPGFPSAVWREQGCCRYRLIRSCGLYRDNGVSGISVCPLCSLSSCTFDFFQTRAADLCCFRCLVHAAARSESFADEQPPVLDRLV